MSEREHSKSRRRNTGDEYALPHMLRSNHAMKYLGINAVSLFNLRPHMHHLDLPRSTLVYPLPFTHMLREEIQISQHQGNVRPARSFARTQAARLMIEAEESYFDRRLNEVTDDDGLVHATNVTWLLNIGNSTITDWGQRDDVEIVRKGHKVYVPAAVIREFPWRHPEDIA